jgi:hypothetical protein
MLKISIAERYRPFSHTPGIKLAIPYSDWCVEVYPAKLCFFSIHTSESFEIKIGLNAFPDRFTATCDLERGGIKVEMKVQEQLLRYWIFEDSGLLLFLEKGKCNIVSDRARVVSQFQMPSFFNSERLSFGVTKKQDWDLICRRRQVREFVPIWFRLGQMRKEQGALSIPSEEQLNEQFSSCFTGIMVPDSKLPPLMGVNPPKAVIQSGSIRGLFFREEVAGILEILPHLPHCFPEGRFTGIAFSLGTLDMEWAKGCLRKLIIHAEKQGSVQLKLPKENASYRLRSTGEPSLDFQPGCEYFLDQFLCR